MIIDLQKIPIHWITVNTANSTTRQSETQSMFNRLNLTNTTKHSSDRVSVRGVGCAESHLKVQEEIEDDLPVLILEDDCLETEHFKTIIEVPDDADALYLGQSSWGPVNWSEVNKDIIRISQVLTTHAIIIINKDYLSDCIKNIKKDLENRTTRVMHDATLAREQKYWKVYATTHPLFYQHRGSASAQGKSITEKPSWLPTIEDW